MGSLGAMQKGKEISSEDEFHGKSFTMKGPMVAEGVEETLQFDFLKDKQCDWIQGYLMSRPLGDAAMAEYLLRQQEEK